ncbi:2-oxo-4-hydroxy-4-carboxy-5-ureidoimidazoline decarboxylase [Cellulosimicrobium sp. Marseille-Q4280]|jgi:2-oxo-4-hydroxy-4-carboxy-5-ureidoimidazoline decarboxylase|uniref:2-oxo-4-hydroxy-4-carboxy-5-ureidoimidazoline decarboxylase n=1 Tax=Cellulosimicrobium sp. Marseille-Q4280 TaxID=2937992 RepID=UPI00203EAEF9|nr:2-oxo-4-hydroxy-4-carboxy-5-ureidoimidazoline decarboxylase [Cellulosimicrobium sp. Marseille-Q4280]
MTLDEFNRLSAQDARDALLACAHVERWADDVAAGRPYATVADAVDAAATAANPWTDAEIDAALSRHPRIGERADGEQTDARMSRSEQSGVDTSDDDVARRLADGNRAYEETFGHVFLVRAAGRSAEEILEQLTERLGNDARTERANAARNLREIAALRLEGVLSA